MGQEQMQLLRAKFNVLKALKTIAAVLAGGCSGQQWQRTPGAEAKQVAKCAGGACVSAA